MAAGRSHSHSHLRVEKFPAASTWEPKVLRIDGQWPTRSKRPGTKFWLWPESSLRSANDDRAEDSVARTLDRIAFVRVQRSVSQFLGCPVLEQAADVAGAIGRWPSAGASQKLEQFSRESPALWAPEAVAPGHRVRLDDIGKLDASLAAVARLRTADTSSEIRLRSRGRSMRRPERVHMPDPFREIEGDREHGQDGDQQHHDRRQQRCIEVETLLGQD